jgi:hypothetical protein
MNAFNRLVMLIVALLLIAVPVSLLLVGLGALPAELVGFTGFRNALDTFLNGLSSVADGELEVDPRVRPLAGILGALVALVALLLLLRELTFGRPVARRAFVDETPGRETAVTAQAVRRLAEGAAREVGAVSPTCYLASTKRRYDVSCNIRVPTRSHDFAELATRVRQNIQSVLEDQQVPIEDVEVTVQGTAPQG